MLTSYLPNLTSYLSPLNDMHMGWTMAIPTYCIKGALDNFSLIPKFFFKKVEIFISLEVYTYVVTAC